MLRITAKQQLMREIVDVLSVLTSEAKLVWGEKGLSVSVVDGSHVALLSATIADECFETYEVEPVEIGLDLQMAHHLRETPCAVPRPSSPRSSRILIAFSKP